MLKNKTILIVLSLLLLNACSSVSGMFESKNESPSLEGERISVLELQRTLTPDAGLEEGQKLDLPESWVNSSWPQAGGYPNHVMQNLSLTNADLRRIWSSKIGAGSSDELPLNAQPVVVRGVVYTLDTKSKLSAFDAQNGQKLWRVNVKDKGEDEEVISGGVSFAHGTVYVTNGYDEILAVAAKDGDIKWRKRLPAPSRAAPTVIGSRVFVSTIDSRLVALDAKDGASLWEYTGIGEMAGLLGAASPAANNEIVIPVFSSGEITALRVENGSVAWSDNLSNVRNFGGGVESLSDIRAMPVVDNGIVVAISFSGKLVAIDERTGTRIWQKEIGGSQSPWVAGKYVFVLSSENQLIALNIDDGSILWISDLEKFKDKKKKHPIYWSGPVMGSDRLILAGSHGYVIEVDAHSGKVVKKLKIKKNIQIAPVIANETLYLLSEDGTLLAYK